jgi:hypothetical protein
MTTAVDISPEAVAATVNNLHDITFMAAKGSWAADAAELAMQQIQELRSSLTARDELLAELIGYAEHFKPTNAESYLGYVAVRDRAIAILAKGETK